MKKKLKLLLILALALGYFFTKDKYLPNNKKVTEPAIKSFSGEIKVIDGDSIKVDGNEVRLMGVDAPEYKQTCYNAKNVEYQCGKVSKEYMITITKGKKAICNYEHKDMYHRFLAECFVENISLNEAIVRNGMAVIYDMSNTTPRMTELEDLAKKDKLGVWQGAFQLPKDYRREHKRK